ncbi:hypothetical protein L211DRAFT_838431, partial [Terfezia boudieri ATCC MYA-4762]
HLFHLGSIHAFPTIQPDLPMQGGGLVHLCARGTRSGLQRSQRSLGSFPKAGVFELRGRTGSLTKAGVFTQHRVLQPKRGSSPNIGSNGVFELSELERELDSSQKFCWHLPLKAGALLRRHFISCMRAQPSQMCVLQLI